MSVFVEAEDFKLPPAGWAVVNGHGIDMYAPAVSGGKTIRFASAGTATLNVNIPSDGTYFMWMWLTKWVVDCNIQWSIEQNHQVVASSTFNRPQDQQPNWSYDVQCGDTTAQLKAGPATLKIYCATMGSSIDCVMLTKATLRKERTVTGPQATNGLDLGNLIAPWGEVINWHVFTPTCFVRFTILTLTAPAVTATVSSRWHHEPWTHALATTIGDSAGKPVPPGKPSAWSEITPALDTAQNQASVWLMFQGVTPLPRVWRLKLEIAAQPTEKAIVRTFDEEWDGDQAGYVMPGDIAKFPQQIASMAAITDHDLAFVQGLALPGGRQDLRPKHLSILGEAYSASPRLFAKEALALAGMGINAVPISDQGDQAAAAAAGMNFSKAPEQHFIHDGPLTSDSFDPVLGQKLEKDLTDWADDIRLHDPVRYAGIDYVILADEPGAPGLAQMVSSPVDQAAFRQWLGARGYTSVQCGATSWDQVNLILPDPKLSAPQRMMGWLSYVFAGETTPLPYKHATEILQKEFHRPVGTRVNFSDERMNGFSQASAGLNWFDFDRMGATTIPWTEDWCFANPHLTSFLADFLRSTAPQGDEPLGMYIIWGYGPPLDPNSAALRTMAAVARGVKYIDHYWYGPYYASTECAFSEDKPYVRNVAFVDRVLGLADDLLGPAIPARARVAILWSQATELWKPDDAFGTERHMLHFALSLQQIPVDFLCEKDLATKLKDYKVLYLPANNLPRESVKALDAWVQAGGTLVVCGGGPQRDESNEPLHDLWPTLGLTNVAMKMDILGNHGDAGLAGYKPTGEVTSGAAHYGVAGYQAVLTGDPFATVRGTYADGSAAIIENQRGKGRTLTFGFNPGITLLMAMDVSKCKSFWNVFPKAEMDLIAQPVGEAGAWPPVSTEVGVDAARLDGPQGSVVTLANFTLKPIARLSVLVRGVSNIGKVISVLHGPLNFARTAHGIRLELPLDAVDVIKIYKK